MAVHVQPGPEVSSGSLLRSRRGRREFHPDHPNLVAMALLIFDRPTRVGDAGDFRTKLFEVPSEMAADCSSGGSYDAGCCPAGEGRAVDAEGTGGIAGAD